MSHRSTRRRPEGATGCRRVRCLAAGGNSPEVAAYCLESVPFVVDLGLRADTVSSEDRQRRTPTLEGVLEQEAADHQWDQGEPPVHQERQPRTDRRKSGGVGLQRPLGVPFAVQFGQSPASGPAAAQRAML